MAPEVVATETCKDDPYDYKVIEFDDDVFVVNQRLIYICCVLYRPISGQQV